MIRKLYALALTAALVLGLAACAAGRTSPAASAQAEHAAPEGASETSPARKGPVAEGGGVTLSDGLVLPVPAEYLPLLTVETGETEGDNAHQHTLASVSETKSIQAGQQDHPGEDWGDGWLFSIVRLDQVGLERFLCYDEMGFFFFAADTKGDAYYIMEHPTDVRLYRTTQEAFEDAAGEWSALCQWADSVPGDMIAANESLEAFDASEYWEEGFTYEGEHRLALFTEPDSELGSSALIILSQPAGAGEGRVWCVERVQYLFVAGEEPYTRLNFPAAMGYDMAAGEYYDWLQTQCDAGARPELLTPEGALEEFIHSDAWFYPQRDMADFTFVEAEG